MSCLSRSTWLVAFGLVWLFAATAGTQWGVSHMETGCSSVLIIMELVTAVISAALINGSQLRPVEWLGGVLIVLVWFWLLALAVMIGGEVNQLLLLERSAAVESGAQRADELAGVHGAAAVEQDPHDR